MTSFARAAEPRERLHGVRSIVRFNWPFYAAGSVTAALALLAVRLEVLGGTAGAILPAGVGLAVFWMGSSLVASWLIYDTSPLMKGGWILPALGFRPSSWICIHAGHDELSPVLRATFGSAGRTFDIFDPAVMTERSIVRARRPVEDGVARADYRRLPVDGGSIDGVMVLLSAHELRSDAARIRLFAEINRALASGGRAIVAEHLRDLPNFLAFGPGFLHFHSERTWRRAFSLAGLVVAAERRITPFVRVFVLETRR